MGKEFPAPSAVSPMCCNSKKVQSLMCAIILPLLNLTPGGHLIPRHGECCAGDELLA